METDVVMETTEVSNSRVDAETIKKLLAPDSIEITVDESELSAAIRQMSETARRRVVFNFSGALPGPPIEAPSLARKLLSLGEKIFRSR